MGRLGPVTAISATPATRQTDRQTDRWMDRRMDGQTPDVRLCDELFSVSKVKIQIKFKH